MKNGQKSPPRSNRTQPIYQDANNLRVFLARTSARVWINFLTPYAHFIYFSEKETFTVRMVEKPASHHPQPTYPEMYR